MSFFSRSVGDYSSSYAEMFPLARVGLHSPHQSVSLFTSGKNQKIERLPTGCGTFSLSCGGYLWHLGFPSS